jgi:hypothetical protein
MVNFKSFFGVVKVMRVIAGNVDRVPNKVEVARHGLPVYDEKKSLGFIGFGESTLWAQIYGTSMVPEGISDGAIISYELVSYSDLKSSDIVLVHIEGEKNKPKLHGGYKLRKYLGVDEQNPQLFNEVSYDKDGKPHANVAKLSLVLGRVLFH